jgi:SAM-dependent methyltransferase
MSSPASQNTSRSFHDKWHRNEQLAFAETLREGSEIQQWILGRNGFQSLAELKAYLRGKRRILDAGCGNGRITALLRECSPVETSVVGVDLVAADVAARNLDRYRNVEIRQGDLLDELSWLGRFDFIYCQEVLHHTADPQRAFGNLCTLLEPCGEIAIYVYKRKAPAREFVDDYLRDRIAGLPYEEAMAVCREITALGRALWESRQKVQVPAVKALDIEAGEYDVQRFLYHFFVKCFWNSDLSFEENAVVNYDWYHPETATRHTLEEVEGWFASAGLQIQHRCIDFYGITIRGIRL